MAVLAQVACRCERDACDRRDQYPAGLVCKSHRDPLTSQSFCDQKKFMAACAFWSPVIGATLVFRLLAIWSASAMTWSALTVHFSSAQVSGIAEGERLPDYFPVDDAHPRRAMRPYGLSKCLAEDLCAGFTARIGIASVSLRPVWVWDPGQYQRIEEQWRAELGVGAVLGVRRVRGRARRGQGGGAGRHGSPDRASSGLAVRRRHCG